MTEEQRKEALVWYQRYFTQIYGGPIPDLPHHKTICAALQSQKVPVIDGLDEAIWRMDGQDMTGDEFGHEIMRAARAYAKLQKGE